MERGWKIVLAFIAGAIWGELSSDPTDAIFFRNFSQLSGEQALFYWYFLTASFYLVLFIAAYIVAKTGIVSPENFVYVMMALVVGGFFLTWETMNRQVDARVLIVTLGIPLTVSLGLLTGLRSEVD
ncbi:MAG: hypothetical protein QXH59_09675 [Candidatus Caldarchaeum sp.]